MLESEGVFARWVESSKTINKFADGLFRTSECNGTVNAIKDL